MNESAGTVRVNHVEEKINTVASRVDKVDIRLHVVEDYQTSFKNICRVLWVLGTIMIAVTSWYSHALDISLRKEQVKSLSAIQRTVISLKKIHLTGISLPQDRHVSKVK